jgi:endonuclease/exonuclease/phosphatase family metal-dependent hydrolase
MLRRTLLLPLLALAAACSSNAGPVTPPGGGNESVNVSVSLPAAGTASTFDVGTWNVEWFGSTANGPANEALQLVAAAEIISDLDLDLWSVQEIVSADAFGALVDSLPGYEGLLANDPGVVDGPAFYSDFDDTEQKIGFIWKSSLLSVDSARVILTENDFEFAGRPPLELQATLDLGGAETPVVLIALHAKAGADREDWVRRTDAAAALKSYLDTRWPDANVFVLGDFNDDVDVSIHNSETTPYSGFLNDGARWSFATEALTAAGETSTVNFGDVIDHILVSDEAWAGYVDASADVLSDIASSVSGPTYGDDVSDHYPVLARFTVGG